ncbi:UpxY family transcription antiterminator [Ancylomarina euxinus]|uniref:UpxY family transcription antiterminator n=1 Tax=Ancylomarina euxinus TaxID=2283627 RepID=A0A425Y6P9_9BACT|nr:UpxY family transcription antiterminator [Ancylomarina euxinus]MCZ4694028.1 UpxY family transcription antiterminator [Ancylomarina euxinus]MUP14552.1 UpxY family transcription antiterminator [Ancylomarina euxinus]RRG24101.1 UpxY family transcription antiterminator [Ancylomarina euxinus]
MKVLKRNYRWYAIYTRSRSEKKLYKELLDKGVESYLPLKREMRVWSDRKKWVETPLFSSYVFVRVSEREYYDAISSHWAVRYVCFEGRAIPIPDSQIESLKLFLEDTKRDVELTSRSLKKGDHLEVTIGPLKGVRGELLQLRGQHRIVIRFISLGCCVHADISLDEVKRLKTPIETTYIDN